MIKERKCNKCGETKSIDKFKKRHRICLYCEEIIENDRKEKKSKRKLIEDLSFREEYNASNHKLYRIAGYIKEGYSNEIIKKAVFKTDRNASFDLTKSAKFRVKRFPESGKTPEHINGRTTLAKYQRDLMVRKEIASGEDLYNFILQYGVYIYTDSKFNSIISEYQNVKGAILPSVYIEKYEEYHNIKLTEEEKENLSTHFLSVKYGQISDDDLINEIRRNIELYNV